MRCHMTMYSRMMIITEPDELTASCRPAYVWCSRARPRAARAARLVHGLPGRGGEDLVDVVAQAHQLARLVVDVARLPARRAGRVVQHDARVGQRVPLALPRTQPRPWRPHPLCCRHGQACQAGMADAFTMRPCPSACTTISHRPQLLHAPRSTGRDSLSFHPPPWRPRAPWPQPQTSTGFYAADTDPCLFRPDTRGESMRASARAGRRRAGRAPSRPWPA
jgi:hypothetical protein